jgi:hypothetical protein
MAMAATTPRLRYHCVSVVPGAQSCAAAKSFAGQRLMSADAPRLPLATCQTPGQCQCTYRHHDDRRAGPRRADERGDLADPWSATDRRHFSGRRATD